MKNLTENDWTWTLQQVGARNEYELYEGVKLIVSGTNYSMMRQIADAHNLAMDGHLPINLSGTRMCWCGQDYAWHEKSGESDHHFAEHLSGENADNGSTPCRGSVDPSAASTVEPEPTARSERQSDQESLHSPSQNQYPKVPEGEVVERLLFNLKKEGLDFHLNGEGDAVEIITSQITRMFDTLVSNLGQDHPYWKVCLLDTMDTERMDWLEERAQWREPSSRVKVIFPVDTGPWTTLRLAIDEAMSRLNLARD